MNNILEDDYIGKHAVWKRLDEETEHHYGAVNDGLNEAMYIVQDFEPPREIKYAIERYVDLCKYFNCTTDNPDATLRSSDEFNQWLDRMLWHVKEVQRLYVEKLDQRESELKSVPNQGQWVIKRDWHGYYGVCSQCGKSQREGKVDFCPHCGADMRYHNEYDLEIPLDGIK